MSRRPLFQRLSGSLQEFLMGRKCPECGFPLTQSFSETGETFHIRCKNLCYFEEVHQFGHEIYLKGEMVWHSSYEFDYGISYDDIMIDLYKISDTPDWKKEGF